MNVSRRHRGSALLAATMALAAARAGAESGDETRARALFREGVTLQDGGDPGAALEKYRAAYELWNNPKIQANIGAACDALGRPLEAARAYDRFLDATPTAGEGRKAAEAALAADLRKIGTLSVVTSAELETLTIDGSVVADHPERVRVSPGTHSVDARAKDGRTGSASASVAAGMTQSVVVELAARPEAVEAPPSPLPPQAPSEPAPASTQQASSSSLPWIIGGVGVAGLLASGAFYLVRANAVSDLEHQCGRTACPGSAQGTIDRANLFGPLSLAALGVGIAGVGTSIVLLSTGSSSGKGAEVALSIAPAGPAAVAKGRF